MIFFFKERPHPFLWQFLVRYSDYINKPYSVPWLGKDAADGHWYIRADTVRDMQEGISKFLGGSKKDRGAAASALFPVFLT